MSKASEIAASMFSIGEELENEANEFEEKIATEVEEVKPFKMSDYIKAQDVSGEDEEIELEASEEEVEEVEKEATEKDNKPKEEGVKALKRGAGVTGIGLGAQAIGSAVKSGELDGVKKMTHITDAKNVESIKKQGLKGTDITKENLTMKGLGVHMQTGAVKPEDLKGKVYLANKKTTENVLKAGRAQHGTTEKASRIKVNMPIKDLKKVQTDNPEMLGAKNLKDFTKRQKKSLADYKSMGGFVLNEPTDKDYKAVFNSFGNKGTTTIQGDVASKYVKGSKDYQKNSLKAVGKHIKENPKMFAKGIGKAVGGTALVGAGAKLVHDGFKKSKSEKVAFAMLEEAGFVKIASEKDIIIEKVAFAILEEAGLMK